jgi:uncharacterized beta-barrel protein YwiB (DUF1934 family)
MKKITEARIKILSVIENLDSSGLAEEEAERDESERAGFYNYSEEGIEITYSDVSEQGRMESVILIKDESVTVKRSGAICSELFFKEGETHNSVYSVPPYKFDASVSTKRIRRALDESGGTLDLHYKMSIGGADKSARMKIWIYPDSKQA